MQTTIVRSWSATLVGVFFTLVTCFVLLEDVLRHHAAVNTKHVMTLAVLAGTIYFGHRWWAQVRQWHIGTALGCAVLFLAGTTTCVLMSAGRNAEVVTTKSQIANSVNMGRQTALKDRDEAKARYDAALKAEEAECASGDGAKCQSKRITRKLRREDYDVAEAKLRTEQPEQIANADIKAAANLLARFPLVTADAEAIEALLQILFPFLQSLFCEIAAIVGFSMGLGHRTAIVSRKQLPPPTPKRVLFRQPEEKPVHVDPVIVALRRAKRPVSNDELAEMMNVSKGEASKRVTDLNGAVQRLRVGREVAISLPEWRQP